MSEKEILGFVSVFLSAIGYSTYIVSVCREHTRPHAFSWTIWSILMLIVFLAQRTDNAGPGAWVTGFSATACIVIAILAMLRGEKNITRSDWLTFLGALIAIPLWHITKDPLWAVIVATIIDGLAYYPTFRKSWHRPLEENYFSFSMDICKWIAALTALTNYSPTTLIYPLFLLLANSTLVTIIIWRRRVA